MYYNNKKLLGFSILFVLGLVGLLWGYSEHQSTTFRARQSLSEAPKKASSGGGVHGRLLAGDDPETQALVDRNARRGRSPAFVPGTLIETVSKDAIEKTLREPKYAASQAKLKEYFPDSSPVGFWIRAAISIGSVSAEEAVSPEAFEMAGKIYAEVLNGEESSVASLGAALQSIPRSEGAYRTHAFRMLSDLGLKNRDLRDSVKTLLIGEATRAGSPSDGALAYRSVLRMNPTKEWYSEVSHSYERLHPGSELSDFVSLNVANL